jgi:hypothetical protein
MQKPRERAINVAEAEKHGLGAVQGWLCDDDPLLIEMKQIVSERFKHRPRTLPSPGRNVKQ